MECRRVVAMIPMGDDLPQAARALVPWLKLAHGLFNGALLVLFFSQGWLGHCIRRERRAGLPASRALAGRHRRIGPLLAALCPLGFFAGMLLVLMDRGRIGVYPLHLFLGLAIVLAVGGVYSVSRKISAGDGAWRDLHRQLGILVLGLYSIQALLGLGILF